MVTEQELLTYGIIGGASIAGIITFTAINTKETGVSDPPELEGVKVNWYHYFPWSLEVDIPKNKQYHEQGKRLSSMIFQDGQNERETYVQEANQAGFDQIILDEQIDRGTITKEQLVELQSESYIPITLVGTGQSIGNLCQNWNLKKVYVELYNADYKTSWNEAQRVPCQKIPVINIADPRLFITSNLEEVVSWITKHTKLIWVWGLNTHNPGWDETAIANWEIIKKYYG